MCIGVDSEITWIRSLGRLGRAVRDNFGHTVMSGALWLCVVSLEHATNNLRPNQESKSASRSRLRGEHGIAMACGSLLDLDHFMAAGSLRLSDATHLR